MANFQTAYDFHELKKVVDRLEKDFYRGNGLPGITTRMSQAEDKLKSVENNLKDYIKDQKTRMNILLAAVFSVLAGVITSLIIHH